MISDLKSTAEIRHELHRIPEAGFCEFKTQQYIINYLTMLGYEPEKCAGTGVVCFIDMNKAETIALRSDMDGLKIKEQTDIDYKSVHEGMMHACGHDAHMSMLLSLAAKIAVENLIFDYNVLLIFQPAEEGPGGAKEVISQGIFERYNVKYVLAMHLSPDYPKGYIALRAGEFFAGGAELYFNIKGVSCHGADPQKGKSALMAGICLINELNANISEKIKNEEGVMSLGSFNSGTTMNIIPENCQISGIIRTYSMKKRCDMLKDIEKICGETAMKTGCKISFEPVVTYPPLLNDTQLSEKIFNIIKNDAVIAKKTTLTEDFAYFALEKPSVMMLLGIRDEYHEEPLHSSRFGFDESVLDSGVEYYINILKNLY